MVVRSPQCFASFVGYCPGEKCKYMKGITMNYPTVRGHGARFRIHTHKVPQSATIISYHVLEIFKKFAKRLDSHLTYAVDLGLAVVHSLNDVLHAKAKVVAILKECTLTIARHLMDDSP